MKTSFLLKICQIACIISFFFLLTHSSLVLDYAKSGLSSWAFSVLPVLLPFIILSKLWIYYDVPQLFYRAVCRALPGHSHAAVCLTVLLLGLSSGFPVGAIFVRYFYEKGILSKRAADGLLPLCSFVSPMFLIGYVRPLTGYTDADWYLFVLSLYLPLLLCFGSLLVSRAGHHTSKYYPGERAPHANQHHPAQQAPRHVPYKNVKTASPSTLRDVWLSSLEIIFTIGIYMMLFSILFGITLHEPMLRHTVTEITLSNLEITTGIGWLSRMSALSGIVRGAVMAAVVSLGGLCTMAQVHSATISCPFSMSRYLLIKVKCALLSAGLFLLTEHMLSFF